MRIINPEKRIIRCPDCDSFLFLGSNEHSSMKEISEMLGKMTLNKRNYSVSKGSNGSSSQTIDYIGKDLKSADQIRLLENQSILFVRNCLPVLDDKIETQNLPAFQEAVSYGSYDYNKKETGTVEMFGALGEEETAFFHSHHFPAICFSNSELDEIDDITKTEMDYEKYLNQAAMQIWIRLRREQKEIAAEMETAQSKTLKELVMDGEYSDAQIAEANAGLEAGLSEEQVLSYFCQEYSAERMRMLRLLLCQTIC